MIIFIPYPKDQILSENDPKSEFWSSKKARIKGGQDEYMKPDGFIEYFNQVNKEIGQNHDSYSKGYRTRELNQSFLNYKNSKHASKNINDLSATFISRGPGNVGGRTRAIAVDPDDQTHCTWIAGAASGGLWKTTDCGLSWINISEGLPNLSTNSIAQAASNPDVIYVGTGEVFAGNATFVRGDGIYKSTDRGGTWSLLNSTVDNTDYISVNRIAVDPLDEDILVIATNSGIYKSTDGGNSWIETFDSPAGSSVQDLQVNPDDFSIQYAGVNSRGIYKSIDAGQTWVQSSEGISEGLRFEVAVAPSNPDVVYTSTYVGTTTILYVSTDSGETWVKAKDESQNTDFLGGQGWYDNTIEVNPYDATEVFVGGVSIGKFKVNASSITESDRQFLGIDEENTSFLSFVNFGATYNSGSLNISDGSLSPSQNPVSVEIRWGGDNVQKAHRFEVPSNGGSNSDGGAGVPVTNYSYQDYVDVPFEVWDIENDRQLMVSFRDQEADGTFNLNPRDDNADPELLTAREYLYIHDITYDPENPDSDITGRSGGVEYKNMYYFWPILAEGAIWNPSSFTDAILRFKYGAEVFASAQATTIYDAYGDWNGENRNTLHPDHHNLTFVKTNEANKEFMVVNGNDGAFGFSSDNGITFEEREKGYVTSQFYGADKKPGEDKFIGGTQDNGTWVSNGENVDNTNSYSFVLGGDGFEVLWNSRDSDLVLGTIYNNRIYKSTNGGTIFQPSSTGIANDDGPFITRLANSKSSPNIVYAIGDGGVYKSTDFGSNWTLKSINSAEWAGNNSSSDVEVSLANDSIVWAGAGMASGVVRMFVSTDKGESYKVTDIPLEAPRAYCTGIYTHPIEEETAYILFSVADRAKILKTENLGVTWTDISGFGTGADQSNNGFPDVYVHSLLVMPFNTDIIWVGTEIGLFESLDGGETWNIRNDFPSVSIWSMKAVDDQIVIGTHGRGIWTATIDDLSYAALSINDFTYNGYGNAEMRYSLPNAYEQLTISANGVILDTIESPEMGDNVYSFDSFTYLKGAKITISASAINQQFRASYSIEEIDSSPEILKFETGDLVADGYPIVLEVENTEPFNKVEVYFDDQLVHTDNQTLTVEDEKRIISFKYQDQGTFTVTVKSYLGNIVFESVLNNVVTSNQSAFERGVSLYPNPVVSELNIEDETSALRRVQIFTSNGKLVKSLKLNEASRLTTVNVGELEEGMYLVQLTDKNGAIKTKRIVKQ
ncbi:hypothetical protein GCM10027429_11720 [Marivirga atlantica]|jgi:photosystem II stability/assembly factor-like uncharacterized protein